MMYILAYVFGFASYLTFQRLFFPSVPAEFDKWIYHYAKDGKFIEAWKEYNWIMFWFLAGLLAFTVSVKLIQSVMFS